MVKQARALREEGIESPHSRLWKGGLWGARVGIGEAEGRQVTAVLLRG